MDAVASWIRYELADLGYGFADWIIKVTGHIDPDGTQKVLMDSWDTWALCCYEEERRERSNAGRRNLGAD